MNSYISEDAIIGKNVLILNGSRITGKSRIMDNSIIGPNSEIVDSVIEEGSTIKNSVIEYSRIGKNCQIGPFAHLRENTIIKDNVRIGNFVEIKKSIIGNNTKCAHLTYIGDTICGDNVNFGCGVVTCNYDGVKKHQTIIEDNVFIGSNCNLIAPIIISKNSFIAAGTTVTNDVLENEFVIGRVKQNNRKKY